MRLWKISVDDNTEEQTERLQSVNERPLIIDGVQATIVASNAFEAVWAAAKMFGLPEHQVKVSLR